MDTKRTRAQTVSFMRRMKPAVGEQLMDAAWKAAAQVYSPVAWRIGSKFTPRLVTCAHDDVTNILKTYDRRLDTGKHRRVIAQIERWSPPTGTLAATGIEFVPGRNIGHSHTATDLRLYFDPSDPRNQAAKNDQDIIRTYLAQELSIDESQVKLETPYVTLGYIPTHRVTAQSLDGTILTALGSTIPATLGFEQHTHDLQRFETLRWGRFLDRRISDNPEAGRSLADYAAHLGHMVRGNLNYQPPYEIKPLGM